jgi:hypothetical protein
VTLAYVKAGEGARFRAMDNPLTGRSWETTEVLFSDRQGTLTPLLLGGESRKSLLAASIKSRLLELKNCGTGAGGFQPGNSCSRGGDGGTAETVNGATRGSGHLQTLYDEQFEYEEGNGNIKEGQRNRMAQAASAVKDMDTYVAIPPAALSKVLASGEFRTLHDTGKSGGHADPSRRLNFEREYFGETHQIYGYMSNTGQAGAATMSYPNRGEPYIDDPADQYGTARVLLREDVKDRTTFTGDDSWDFNKHSTEGSGMLSPSMLASSVRDPSWKSMLKYASPEWYKNVTDDHRRGGYLEAQIHGGLKAADISRVIFYRKDPPKALVAQLKKAGIPWERRDYVPKPKD